MLSFLFSHQNLAHFGGSPLNTFLFGVGYLCLGLLLYNRGMRQLLGFEIRNLSFQLAGTALVLVGAFFFTFGCAILFAFSEISFEGPLSCVPGLNLPALAGVFAGAIISGKRNLLPSSPTKTRPRGLPK